MSFPIILLPDLTRMRVYPRPPEPSASYNIEVKERPTEDALRSPNPAMSWAVEERKDQASVISTVASHQWRTQPGSTIGEPEKRKFVRAILNQVKLPRAITGRQNRAFFGRSGSCVLQVGFAWCAWPLAVFGVLIMILEDDIEDVGSAGSAFDEDGESIPVLALNLCPRKFSDLTVWWKLDP